MLKILQKTVADVFGVWRFIRKALTDKLSI